MVRLAGASLHLIGQLVERKNMNSRLQKLFVLLKHCAEIARLQRKLPTGDEDEVVHDLLQKCLANGYENNPLLNEISDLFFPEEYGVTFGKSVVRLHSLDEETTFLLTGAVLDSQSEFGNTPSESVLSYILTGQRYREKDNSYDGSVIVHLRPGTGESLEKVKDLP